MRKQRFLAVLLSAALAFIPVIDVMAEENAAQTEEGSSTGKTEESGEVDQTENQDIQGTDGEGTDVTNSTEVSESKTGEKADTQVENNAQEVQKMGVVGGYIPSNLDNNTPVYQEESKRGRRARSVNNTIPEKYPLNGIEEIKEKYPANRNQNPYGTCWSFASMGLAEYDLLNKDLGFDSTIDLSELQLIYFTYNFVTDPLGGTVGDVARYYNYTGKMEDSYFNRGGNYEMAVRRLFQWNGAVKEEDVPYKIGDIDNVVKVEANGLLDQYAYNYDFAHIQNAYNINIKDNCEKVKEQIMQHGAVGAAYTHYYACMTKHLGSTESEDEYVYYDTEADSKNTELAGGGHAVMIVGWDDNYSRDNFSGKEKPENNGAWLVRNSWGEYQNYFWMSYDTYSIEKAAWAFDFTTKDNYDNNYQYDGGVYTASSPMPRTTVENVFTVPQKKGVESEILEAVSVSMTHATNVEYTIDVYTDINTLTKPDWGTYQTEASTTGKTDLAGIYTIKLNKPVELKPGSTYAVVVKTNKNAVDYEQGLSSEPLDGSMKWTNVVSQDNNKSFYKNTDESMMFTRWLYGNFCIKAYTNDKKTEESNDFCEKVKGYTVTLNGTVDLNYNMEIPKNIMQEDQDAYVEFTVNGEQRSKIKVKDAEDKGTAKVFTCNVAAKEMTSDITANLVVNGQKGKDHIYSVKEYADQIINNSSGGYSPEAINLVKAMLNYGASAQNFFNFKSENLANTSLDEADKNVKVVELADFSKYKGEIKDASDMGINYCGSSLSLNADTNVKDYFTLSEGHKIDEYSFSYKTNGKSIEVKPGTTSINNETHYYVDIPGIAAQHLDKEIAVTIKRVNDGKTVTWKYNPFSYGYVVKEKAQDNKELNAVMDALYSYWQRADAYMKSMK